MDEKNHEKDIAYTYCHKTWKYDLRSIEQLSTELQTSNGVVLWYLIVKK